MSLLDAAALEQQIEGISVEAAAALLSKKLNHALDTDPDFFARTNWDAAFPVLVWLAQRDSDRTEAFFERFQAKYEQGSTEWARKTLSDQLALLQREKQLKALSAEELEAQLVVMTLLPEGKPAADVEQEALIRALLLHNPERACRLAITWWEGKWQFEETVQKLVDICWKADPKNVLTLLMRWYGPSRESLTVLWTERVIREWGANSAPLILQLLEVMPASGYVERQSILRILEALPEWDLPVRRPVLSLLIPAIARLMPYMYKTQEELSAQMLQILWQLDSGSAWEWKLHGLFYAMVPPDRLRFARKLKHNAILRPFAQPAHAMAIVVQRGKILSDYLNRKYVRPDHRRRWRSFLALEGKIQRVQDDTLRKELLKSHTAVVKETSRARKGIVLEALNTDTREPILVRPGK